MNKCNCECKATDIVVLIDRSGSMTGMEEETIGAFNAFIEEQKKLKDKAFLTLILFDNQYETVYYRADLVNVGRLNSEKYTTRGSTSMYDAIGRTINDITNANKSDKVIFLIQSDGQENTSVEFTGKQIKKLINAKEKRGWDFQFVGTGIDAFEEGAKFGMKQDKTVSLSKTAEGMRSYSNVIGAASTAYRTKQF